MKGFSALDFFRVCGYNESDIGQLSGSIGPAGLALPGETGCTSCPLHRALLASMG